MSENQSQQRTMSWEEVAYSNMIQGEAFLRLLVEKGVLTKEEFVDKLRLDFQRSEVSALVLT